MDKSLIRKEILDIRSKLGENQHKNMTKMVINRFMESEHYKKAKNIMIFISFKDEINTHEFIKMALKDNKNILIPITLPKTKKLKPSQLKDFDELELGFYDILTPREEFIRYVDPKDIDLIIVPGLAFDMDGNRIGFGGGYYDRFLSTLDHITKLSIAFDFQVLDNIPNGPLDIPVDYIYTDKRTINCKLLRIRL